MCASCGCDPRHPARASSARLCAARATEVTACAYPARVHLQCGAAQPSPCCHDMTRYLGGNLIAELPVGIFDKNIKLVNLYVCLLGCAGALGGGWFCRAPPPVQESQIQVNSQRQGYARALRQPSACVCPVVAAQDVLLESPAHASVPRRRPSRRHVLTWSVCTCIAARPTLCRAPTKQPGAWRATSSPSYRRRSSTKTSSLYICTCTDGLRWRPWWSVVLPHPALPFKRARLRPLAASKAMRMRRGNPLRVCISVGAAEDILLE